MQNIFAPGAPWAAPWMPRVLPVVTALAERFAHQTIFTRFITPAHPDEMPGMWRRYYQKWRDLTRERIDPALLELVPELARLVPPAKVFQKARYSAFSSPDLRLELRQRKVNTLVVTGSETDVCIVATVMAAVDLGYRVVVVTDGLCSSSDEGHDALMKVYHTRFAEQIETATAEQVLSEWQPAQVAGC